VSFLKSLSEKKLLLLLSGLTLFSRILFMSLIPLEHSNYWEYGEIARNLYEGKGYSLFYFFNGKIDIYYQQAAHPFPSAYVPPAYVWFLYPFMGIASEGIRNGLILLIQHLASAFCCVLLYRLTKKLFGGFTGLIAALLFAFFPEMIYASNSFGPTVFYHAAVLGILLALTEERLSFVKLGLLFAIGIYLRSELALFLILLLPYLFYRKQFRTAILSTLLCMLLLLPWQIRNYQVFGQLIPFSTSSGLNLYRGNNADGIGSWGWEKNVYAHESELTQDQKFEARMSKLYWDQAVQYMRSHPGETFLNAAKKLFHLWLFMPGDDRTANLFYLLPWLCLLIFSAIGIVYARSEWKRLRPIFIYLFACSLIAMIFFALPRYQSLMKIGLMPLAAYGFVKMMELFRGKEAELS
jgi:4-amino-4-deoxy-L-arabinose transferase-like glycosyltransferase